MIDTRPHRHGHLNSIRDNEHRKGHRKAKNWRIREAADARSARKTDGRERKTHGEPPPCTEQPIGERIQFLVSHRDSLGGIFTGYTWNIRGVFMGYTYVSGMCRVCIGYVSGIYRKIRGGKNEKKLRFLAKKFGNVGEK